MYAYTHVHSFPSNIYNIYLIYIFFFFNIRLIISSFLITLIHNFAHALFILFTNASIRDVSQCTKRKEIRKWDRNEKEKRKETLECHVAHRFRMHVGMPRDARARATLLSCLTFVTFSVRRFLGTSRNTRIRLRVTHPCDRKELHVPMLATVSSRRLLHEEAEWDETRDKFKGIF